MNGRDATLAKLLIYGGTLPLIAAAAAGDAALAGFHDALIAQTYGAIIISFICGIHWSAYLFFAEKCPRHLLIVSNVVALIGWASLLADLRFHALIVQMFCFLFLLAIDTKLRDCGILKPWFYALRRNATAAVVLALSVIAWS